MYKNHLDIIHSENINKENKFKKYTVEIMVVTLLIAGFGIMKVQSNYGQAHYQEIRSMQK